MLLLKQHSLSGRSNENRLFSMKYELDLFVYTIYVCVCVCVCVWKLSKIRPKLLYKAWNEETIFSFL
jgi:hypothetical protein